MNLFVSHPNATLPQTSLRQEALAGPLQPLAGAPSPDMALTLSGQDQVCLTPSVQFTGQQKPPLIAALEVGFQAFLEHYRVNGLHWVDYPVEKVLDGDTIEVSFGSQTYKLRLWGIDAPEMDQPLGPAAKRHLEELIGKQRVQVDFDRFVRSREAKKDPYKRYVAEVFGRERSWKNPIFGTEFNIALRMVEDGYAYPANNDDHTDKWFKQAFADAREKGQRYKRETGKSDKWPIHTNDNIPPWEWRAQKK